MRAVDVHPTARIAIFFKLHVVVYRIFLYSFSCAKTPELLLQSQICHQFYLNYTTHIDKAGLNLIFNSLASQIQTIENSRNFTSHQDFTSYQVF